MSDDDFDRSVVQAFKRFLETVNRADDHDDALTALGRRVQEHLGADVRRVPLVTESVASHRLVDADIALSELAADGELVGVTAGGNREHESLPAMLLNRWSGFDAGAVDYTLAPSGPGLRRRIVAFGLRLFLFDGEPVVVLQRAANRMHGRETASLEVLARESQVAERLVAAIRRLMQERSVLRGQVLTFTGGGDFGEETGSMFVRREAIPGEDVVLPDGVLDTIRRHVLGIAEHREVLLAAGRHLKRGVLLYGPPGTGKTLTVRHLVGADEDATVVLLTGPGIGFIREATDLARAMQPALVVLEDIDLVAMQRGRFGPQPLLFAVLDALDGLDGDADVTFLMTTNRVDVLERALAQRPGRVDLAVEVPRPDAAARRALFALYARGLPLSAEAVGAAAERAEGVTASFAKELMRRVVLAAAVEARAVSDDDLVTALDGMLADGAELTRALLGMGPDGFAEEHDAAGSFPEGPSATFGWTAYAPGGPAVAPLESSSGFLVEDED
jgi:hypothetical protein